MSWGSVLGALGGWAKQVKPSEWISIGSSLGGALMQGKGQSDQAKQVAPAQTAADQLSWYGAAIPGMWQQQQAAVNSAMGNYDPYGDYERGTKMLGAGDLYRNREANLAGIKGMQPGWLQGRTGSAWMPTRSQAYIDRLSAPALASLQADKEKNLLVQSQGQFQPSNLAAGWGEDATTQALQQALANERASQLSSWEGKQNAYIDTMQKGYGDLSGWQQGQNQGGGMGTGTKVALGAAAAATPWLLSKYFPKKKSTSNEAAWNAASP